MNTFTRNGREYSYKFETEDYQINPWEEFDGHGVVSGWETRDKLPCEIVLHSDGRHKLFYDFQATMKKAKSEGWGISDDEMTKLAKKLGRNPTKGEILEKSVINDYEYLRKYCAGIWYFGYLTVTDDETGESATIGMVDSDSVDFFAAELADELQHEFVTKNRFKRAIECGI